MHHSAGVWLFPGRILGTLNFIMALALGAAYVGALVLCPFGVGGVRVYRHRASATIMKWRSGYLTT